MDIKILGTRGEIETSAPYHSKNSGTLIDKAKKISFKISSKLSINFCFAKKYFL